MLFLFIKYKPVYTVELSGEKIGYVKDKNLIEDSIQEYIDNADNIAFVDTNSLPKYNFSFVGKNIETNEEEILLAVKESTNITYRSFAIKLDGEVKETVKTFEEAESIVNQIKDEYQQDLELDLSIEEIYSTQNPNEDYVESEIATADLSGMITTKIEEKHIEELIANSEAEIDGIYLSRPLSSGMLTSRFGERSSIRSGAHTGLDIAASYGSPIKPVSDGVVTYAGTQGSYGKLVIISHGNGIESYYGHCSSIYVNVGQEVTTNTTIAAVGSTGNSTGNHLHLEIRKDGEALNPQKYLYK